MKRELPIFNYNEEFNTESVIRNLIAYGSSADGIALSSIGGAVIPVPSMRDQILGDKVLNTVIYIPKVTSSEFSLDILFFLQRFINELNQKFNFSLSTDSERLYNKDGKIVGLTSGMMFENIGAFYVPVFIGDVKSRSGKQYNIGNMDIPDDKIDEVCEFIDTIFKDFVKLLFRQSVLVIKAKHENW